MWQQDDIPEVLALMWQLARFEGYDDQFKVTELDLLERGFGENTQFDCIVARLDTRSTGQKEMTNEKESMPSGGDVYNCAEITGDIVGYAVLVYTPFTYDLKPAATLKEFLVKEGMRGYGIGQRLFLYMEQHCLAKGVERLSWLVLNGNSNAEHFYQVFGGTPSPQWLLYEKGLLV